MWLKKAWKRLAPPPRTPPDEWAEQHCHLPSTSAVSGLISFLLTPYFREPLRCLADNRVDKIVAQKSSQIGWTVAFMNSALGWIIDLMPSSVVVMFSKRDAADEFNMEKFEPMVEASPRIAAKVPLTSREKGVKKTFKKYAGGFIKFVWSNSPASVKSTAAKFIFVEEPDDCSQNVKGQGNAIRLIAERKKTYHDGKLIFGGTPTIADFSEVEAGMEESDKRRWMVTCHACGLAHAMAWEHVKWDKDLTRAHAIFGRHLPETARYECPGCNVAWTRAEKERNARNGAWKATAEFRGVAGFYFNELMSPFAGSAIEKLVEKFLIARKEEREGDPKGMIAFYNGTLGLPWAFKSAIPAAAELRERGEAYEELVVPLRGLVLTLSVDVQHNRLAVDVDAWGRGEENWLVYWGEIHGNCTKEDDPVWNELEKFILRGYQHESGAELHVAASAIDASDGNTNDAVYAFVRRMLRKGVKIYAIKGASNVEAEIYAPPKQRSIDPSGIPTKAARYGVRVYQVGTTKAKDLILGYEAQAGRINVTRDGPGKMHWYQDVRADWLEQLVESELKIPKKGQPIHKKFWQAKAGRRNEALDNKVYCLWLARLLRLNLWTDSEWDYREKSLRQVDLLHPPTAAAESDTRETADANTDSPPVAASAPPANPLLDQLRRAGTETKPSDDSRPW
jgi:phage terminase large subunit GpA-like protein